MHLPHHRSDTYRWPEDVDAPRRRIPARDAMRARLTELPVLTGVQTDAGHGTGTATSKIIEEGADVCAFAAHIVGLA